MERFLLRLIQTLLREQLGEPQASRVLVLLASLRCLGSLIGIDMTYVLSQRPEIGVVLRLLCLHVVHELGRVRVCDVRHEALAPHFLLDYSLRELSRPLAQPRNFILSQVILNFLLLDDPLQKLLLSISLPELCEQALIHLPLFLKRPLEGHLILQGPLLVLQHGVVLL